jgi:AraC family transcriptional regulator of adaptative response/methylated-DNA-[protein]-cysteine methyltransferase
MTTSNAKKEVGASVFFTIGECSLGSVLVAQSACGVCSILIGEDPARLAQDLRHQFPKANLAARVNGQAELVAQVAGLIENPGAPLNLPLDVRGTAFQRLVWDAGRREQSGLSPKPAALMRWPLPFRATV